MIIVEITIEQATITIQDKVVTATEDTTIAEVGLMAPGDGNEEAMTVIGVDRQVEIENTEVTLLTDVTIIRTIAMTTEDRIIGVGVEAGLEVEAAVEAVLTAQGEAVVAAVLAVAAVVAQAAHVLQVEVARTGSLPEVLDLEANGIQKQAEAASESVTIEVAPVRGEEVKRVVKIVRVAVAGASAQDPVAEATASRVVGDAARIVLNHPQECLHHLLLHHPVKTKRGRKTPKFRRFRKIKEQSSLPSLS